jgi:UTP:GlnB (protein PII) uridylyltransferase
VFLCREYRRWIIPPLGHNSQYFTQAWYFFAHWAVRRSSVFTCVVMNMSEQVFSIPRARSSTSRHRHELDNLAISATPGQDFLNAVVEKKITVTPASAAQQVANIFNVLDIFPANFNIVTPRQEQDLP